MVNCCIQCYMLCAWWGLDVTSSPSSCPFGSPMDVLPPALLQTDCLSYSLLGGPGPPSAPSLMVTPFPSRSTHSSFPLSVALTVVLPENFNQDARYLRKHGCNRPRGYPCFLLAGSFFPWIFIIIQPAKCLKYRWEMWAEKFSNSTWRFPKMSPLLFIITKKSCHYSLGLQGEQLGLLPTPLGKYQAFCRKFHLSNAFIFFRIKNWRRNREI
jgi:hypothetical protein